MRHAVTSYLEADRPIPDNMLAAMADAQAKVTSPEHPSMAVWPRGLGLAMPHLAPPKPVRADLTQHTLQSGSPAGWTQARERSCPGGLPPRSARQR